VFALAGDWNFMLREGAIVNYSDRKESEFMIIKGGLHTGLNSCYGIKRIDNNLKLRHLRLKDINILNQEKI